MHPNQIQDRRSRLVGNAERLFERGAGRDNDTEHQVKELHAKIGTGPLARVDNGTGFFIRQARSLSRPQRLLGLARSSVYHSPALVSEQDLAVMRLLDEAHLQYPFYGSAG